MTLDDLSDGNAAADMLGVSSGSNAWRILRDRLDEYRRSTGRDVQMVKVGAKMAAVTTDLTAFVQWYDQWRKDAAADMQRRATEGNRRRAAERKAHAPYTVHPYHSSDRRKRDTPEQIALAKRKANLRAAIIWLKEEME
jgi:hypothetical protein